MERLSALTDDQMNERQQAILEDIRSGPRGPSAHGPFLAWLQSPDLADRAQKLGEYLRFEAQMDKRLAELAILTVARKWTAQFEWYAHKKFAISAGLSENVIDSIEQRKQPNFVNEDEKAIYNFSMALQESYAVDDVTFNEAVRHIGRTGVTDLVGLLGYYTLVSMTLNVYQIPLPNSEPPPLDP